MGDEQLEVSDSIRAAIEQIGSYSSVKCIKDTSVGQHAVIVEVEWAVKLPNAFRKQGVSDTGIKEIENVYWYIPLEYPMWAPSPRLRVDFPTKLPHINPYTPGELVCPCISESSLDDLLHSMGLQALLDATCQWLNNAAANELHCPIQGWEHMRRDDMKGLIHVDSTAIRGELDTSGHIVKFYNYRYYYVGDSGDLIIGKLITPGLGSSNNVFKKKYVYVDRNTSIRNAPGILFRTENGEIFSEYQPETVHDFGSLRAFAKDLGLQHAFDARLKYILAISNPQAMQRQDKAPVEEFMVAFAVKRPFNLIGTDSPWELLPYRVSYSPEYKDKLPDETVVWPTSFIERCCPQLLQAVSGEVIEKPINLGLLGCGSLGSKVALHLAKTGCYQFELVDKDYFSSHNNARHGLVVADFNSLCYSKSKLLHRQLSNLNIESKSIDKDIRSMGNKNGFSLNKKTDYVLDTTASLSVRHYLSHHCGSLPGKLIHSTLYGKSTMGIVAIEGISRSVRVDDMAAFLNTLCIDNEQVRNAMYGIDGPLLNHFGEGCGSVTTTMSDTDISLMSAAISSHINTHVKQNNDTEYGVLYVGVINQPSLGMAWISYIFPPTLIISRGGNYNWEIRVLGTVVKKIEELSNENKTLENGGVIAGHICHLSKTIYVNYLLDASRGSIRTRDRFVLSTEGLSEVFEHIHESTNGQITFLGTWHNHTSPTPPSTIDSDSLEKLQANYDSPIVMLTYTGGHIVRVEC